MGVDPLTAGLIITGVGIGANEVLKGDDIQSPKPKPIPPLQVGFSESQAEAAAKRAKEARDRRRRILSLRDPGSFESGLAVRT